MRLVTVRWSGPYNLERISLYDTALDKGVYSISRVWGDTETLLYIGRTKRQFQQRLREHDYWLKNYRGQIKIRLGVLDSDPGMDFSEELLAEVEALLVVWNETVENTSNTRSYSGGELTIKNIGRRGLIDRNISTDMLLDY